MFEMIEHRGNREALANIGNKSRVAGMLEMFLPAACLEYHAVRRHSPFSTVQVATLFDSEERAYMDGEAKFYTHMIGLSKSKTASARKLASRVRSQYPLRYERCVEYFRSYEAPQLNS
jgi:hypothetical protein